MHQAARAGSRAQTGFHAIFQTFRSGQAGDELQGFFGGSAAGSRVRGKSALG
jgi:hypothetical protein